MNTTIARLYGGRFSINKAFLFKAIYIFFDGVVAHADGFTNRGVARMAREGFSVLAVHEECKESNLSVVKSETEHSLWHRKVFSGVISFVVITVIVFQ